MGTVKKKAVRIELRGSECANCRSHFPPDNHLTGDEEENLKPPNSKISNFIIDVNDEEFTIEVSDALIEIYRLHWMEEVESVETEELKRKLILCYGCGVVFAQLCKYYYDFNFLRRANAIITESQQKIEDMLEKLRLQEETERKCKANKVLSPVEEETDLKIIKEVGRKKKLTVSTKEPNFSSDPASNPILTNLLEAPVPASIVQNIHDKSKDLPVSVQPVQPTSFGIKTSVHQNAFSHSSNLLKGGNPVGFMTQVPSPLTYSQMQMAPPSSNDCIISLQQAEHAILTVPTFIQVDSNFINSNFSMPSIAFPPGVQLGPGILTHNQTESPLVPVARTVPPNSQSASNHLNQQDQNQLEQSVLSQVDQAQSHLDRQARSVQDGSSGGILRNQLDAENRTQLDQHSSLPFKCEECGIGFSTRRALSLHRIHHHINEGAEKCFVCAKVFTSKKNLSAHLSIAHKTCEPLGKYVPDAFPMKCVDCTQMCSNFAELHAHRMKVHPVDEPFQCHICRLVLTSAGTYHSHMQLHEMQAVECEFCYEKFPNNSELGRHISACHQFKKVRIEKINLQGANLQPTVNLQPILNLQPADNSQSIANIQPAHLKSKNKSLKKVAPKESVSRNSRYSFSVAKERIIFKCVDCSENFHTAAALGEHRMELHPHEDTYKCHICGKIVSRANSLNDHVRRHTGLRPYRCKICGNSFKTAGDARQHHFAVHGNNGDKPPSNKIKAARTLIGSSLLEDFEEEEEADGDDEEDDHERDFVNFPGVSLIEVNLSDTGSDSFNMEEVEIFD